LRVRNVETLAAVFAGELIVNPDHIVARFGKACAILFVGSALRNQRVRGNAGN
jgi:hypothetical protein